VTRKETAAKFPEKLRCLFQPSRYKFIRGGRGSGKSWGIARALLIQGAGKKLRILCTREVQKSIKQSVHQLLTDQINALGLADFYEVLATEIRGKNGTQFFFAGLSDMTADSIKSFEGCDIVWLEEAQTLTKRSLMILIPTIRKEGSEIWASYNPELETDPIHEMAVVNPQEGAVSVLMNYGDNPWFPATLESERIHAQKTMRPADYAHVWEGQCKPAVEGAIYADEVAAVQEQGRFCRVHYDPLLKAHTVWDLGFNDSMSIILVQRAASELRVIDYIEDNRLPLPDYVARLQAMGLNWGNDWLPHDGFAKRHQTGKSDDEVLKALGRDVLQVPGSEVENGIRQARIVFPRIWFNSESKGVQVLMEHLKRYRRHVSRTTGEASRPLHDAHSHGADAFRYLALVADQLSNSVRKVPRQSSVQAVVGWMG
jgi:phage terminase large subunit